MKNIEVNGWINKPENYTGRVKHNGNYFYLLNGKHHREYGPAVIWNNGSFEYYINNNNITKKVNKWIKENNIPEDWTNSDKITF